MAQSFASDERQKARLLYRDLIDLYRKKGLHQQAQECIKLALQHSLWRREAQRPIDFLPNLDAKPVHNADNFPICQYLERNFHGLELDIASIVGRDGFSPVEEPLVSSGHWEEAIFYEGGIRFEVAAKQFPNISSVVDGLPDIVRQCGVIMLSRLAPGTHIMSHCGFSNRKLRVHLGLIASEHARLRVADQMLEWKTGKCIVFDDSFEHEVWHFGSGSRVVLLVDILHPDLSEQEIAATLKSHEELLDQIKSVMREKGICRIESDGANLKMEPDAYHAKMLRRFMRELNLASISLGDEAELFQNGL